ncbi:unnamed protein product, partial [Musa acuminata subsp. burmannicoides]
MTVIVHLLWSHSSSKTHLLKQQYQSKKSSSVPGKLRWHQ